MAGDDDLPSLDDWGPIDDDFWGTFLVPPPPPPPSLGSVCSSGAPLYCELEGGPMGAHFDRAAFPSLPIIAVCSSVVLVAVLVASFLLWRHKSKVQNLLPCKSEQPGGGHLGEMGTANGITYQDVLINHHHPTTRLPTQPHHLPGTQALMPLEILDVKLGDMGATPINALHHHHHQHHHRGFYGAATAFHRHPLYEEVERSKAPEGPKATDEEEDEEYPSREGSATSSVRGSTGGDLCRDPVSSDDDAFAYHPRYPPPPPAQRIVRDTQHSTTKDCRMRPDGQWSSPSQENIYSTIDEDELTDCHRPSLSSLVNCAPHHSPKVKRKGAEDNGSSYGDILPAYNAAAPFT